MSKNNRLPVKKGDKVIYDILFEKNFDELGKEIEELGYGKRKICIVSESHVAPLYLDHVIQKIKHHCDYVSTFVFTAGEPSKNLDTVRDLYEHLILEKFQRKDVLLALGGGVTGDLTGFTAATYLRGIDFIQVPTTLLSQVDSSIGGKTGVDFLAYKNMVGAFHQPSLVYINMETLKTLPEREFRSGMGEVLKHGLIKNKEYFEWMIEKKQDIMDKDTDVLQKMIYESCLIKKGVVERDPKEKGERAQLNYGHTLGHAIEKKSAFTLTHGECVALGTLAALSISLERGNISEAEYKKCVDLYEYFGFPQLPKEYDFDEIIEITKLDKKMEQGKVKFIILSRIGEAAIVTDVTSKDMLHALQSLK